MASMLEITETHQMDNETDPIAECKEICRQIIELLQYRIDNPQEMENLQEDNLQENQQTEDMYYQDVDWDWKEKYELAENLKEEQQQNFGKALYKDVSQLKHKEILMDIQLLKQWRLIEKLSGEEKCFLAQINILQQNYVSRRLSCNYRLVGSVT